MKCFFSVEKEDRREFWRQKDKIKSTFKNHVKVLFLIIGKKKKKQSYSSNSWLFIPRTDVEAETPILWPPDEKS